MDRFEERNSKHITEGKGLITWQKTKQDLKKKVGATEYAKWIDDLRFVADVDGVVMIAARDRLTHDRVQSEYRRDIASFWRVRDDRDRPARIICWADASADLKALTSDPWAREEAQAKTLRKNPRDEMMSFDTLVVGESNEVAFNLAKRIADGEHMPAPIAFIYGPQGVGKTHLMKGLEKYTLARAPQTQVLMMSAEEFMTRYHAGVKIRDTSDLKRDLRSKDLVLIDDLQWISGKPGTDTEFFASIRAITAAGGQVVLTADTAPGDLTGFSERLRNELQGAMAAEVTLPDETMRRAIVDCHADIIEGQAPRFSLSNAFRDKLVSRVRGPGRNLCGVIWSLYTESGFGQKEITAAMIEKVIIRQEGTLQPPTLDAVKRAAMRTFNVSKSDLESPCKQQSIVYPRQIAMYLCRTLTKKSLPQIGRSFGKRDHTTVLHAVRKISKKMGDDPELAMDVDRVTETLRTMQVEGNA